MTLTAAEIRAFPAKAAIYRKTDEKGLYLEISPRGSKLWRVKYRFNGAEKRLALGAWPEVSLADARALRDDARRKLREGIDPGHEKKMGKIAAQISAGNSFLSVAEDYIDVHLEKSGKAPATVRKSRWFLSLLTPALGTRPIADIEPAELLAVLKKLENKGHRETANRVRSFASRIFRYGVATTRCKHDPAAMLVNALARPTVKHHAAILEPKMLGEFLRAVDGYMGSPVVNLAIQIAPHVFLRPGELRAARWSEIDLENAIWTVPAERAKLRRPHSVPLSRQVFALLRELELHSGGLDLLFPGLRSRLRPISENTLNASYRRMGFDKDTVTAHGLRATASTLLNESGKWHFDAIERALAHGHSDATRGAYARGQHWDERIAMAQWWSDYLDKVRVGGEILPLNRALDAI
ncbi:DUF4102 domain-containing protein [Croceicoccus ponticola]|uniref:DUF4102 domain-containing protein n=1 Tax=Croceicoccus ponticola TaxID=2217664 RepID=A0A437GVG7_9SPHN|nr:integrase arm-type DNA-binding domain-containing protein [Croceicoccus ponticola]RVQ65795.1 DUF4102 domain-containing protein [Croceicoccus ponticola]